VPGLGAQSGGLREAGKCRGVKYRTKLESGIRRLSGRKVAEALNRKGFRDAKKEEVRPHSGQPSRPESELFGPAGPEVGMVRKADRKAQAGTHSPRRTLTDSQSQLS
jgi:hypothetical protein